MTGVIYRDHDDLIAFQSRGDSPTKATVSPSISGEDSRSVQKDGLGPIDLGFQKPGIARTGGRAQVRDH